MANIVLYTICGIISLITLFLIAIYSANKKFRNHLSYFNIAFTVIILLDIGFRFIPASRKDGINSRDVNEEVSILCKVQAASLTFFDKLIITLITSFSIISYVVIFNKGIKEKDLEIKGKNALIISIIISFFFSLILTIIFCCQGISDRSEFCYVETQSLVKIYFDSITTALLFIIDSVFTLIIVFGNKNIDEDKNNWDLKAFYTSLIFNLITLTYVIYLILRILPKGRYEKDLIYIILCLIDNFFFVAKIELWDYISKIFQKCDCCKNLSNDKDNDNNDKDNDIEYSINSNDIDNDNVCKFNNNYELAINEEN